ncbi:MAG: adenylate/guanylate cyclase domain-containing protein [Magnetococcales bacterium]|nr:adenylate/guanylate cyclase domain-containing protein [Magnetococcales bacterium]
MATDTPIQHWKKRLQPVGICLLISGVVFLLLWLARTSGSLQYWELGAFDQTLRWRFETQPVDDRIHLIGVDEEDINRLGWPLSDEIVARALEKIALQNPAMVGIDLYREQPRPPGHERLMTLLDDTPNIIAVMKFQDASGRQIPPPPVLVGSDRAAFSDLVVDGDGVVRRGLLFLDDGVHFSLSFALRLALGYLAPSGIGLEPGEGNPQHAGLGQTTIPPLESNDGGYVEADTRGYQFLFNYPGAPAPFGEHSLRDLLDGTIPPGTLTDKIIIFGAAADSVKDQFSTPVNWGGVTDQPFVFGFSIHAYAVSQLLEMALDGKGLIQSLSDPLEGGWIWFWSLIGGLAGLWAGRGGRTTLRLALSVTGGSLIIGILCVWFLEQGLWLPFFPPLLGFQATLILITAHLSHQERLQRNTVMQLFSSAVSPEVAEEIWQNREEVLAQGRPRPKRLTATVLFTDLVAFTPISEGMDPELLMDWLNEYMDVMANAVTHHGGVVDKFIGDAIMAVFGVPIARESEEEIDQDAIQAVSCALAMGQGLEALNQRWKKEGKPPMAMRVGIFTGPLVAGGLGSTQRMNFTVIGDTVNTAARLESYKPALPDASPPPEPEVCRILIGETTHARLGDRFQKELVDTVLLKGKDKRITIYRVTGS